MGQKIKVSGGIMSRMVEELANRPTEIRFIEAGIITRKLQHALEVLMVDSGVDIGENQKVAAINTVTLADDFAGESGITGEKYDNYLKLFDMGLVNVLPRGDRSDLLTVTPTRKALRLFNFTHVLENSPSEPRVIFRPLYEQKINAA